jgi:hypothetical protein
MLNKRIGNRTTDLYLSGLILIVVGFIAISWCGAYLGKIELNSPFEFLNCGPHAIIAVPALFFGSLFLIVGFLKWLIGRFVK